MEHTIVIVEDDENIRRLLQVALRSQGYDVRPYPDAVSALEAMEADRPDLAIFDIMMEGMDGITAVKLLRQNKTLSDLPVIMLTARSSEDDKVTGLDAGADDYVTKPFSVVELCARVRAHLRRGGGEPQAAPTEVYTGGGLRLDTGTREVLLGEEPIALSFKEFELLRMLMQNAHRAVSRSELLDEVWGGDFFGETRTLDIHVSSLRHKLGDQAEDSRYIRTIRGVGYRFVGGMDT